MFKRIQFPLIAIVCGFLALGLSLVAVGNVHAQTPALLDAGLDAPAAEGSAQTPTVTTTTTTTTTAQQLPDPVEHPIDAGNTLYKLYKSGGLVPAIIVGLFMLLTFASRKVKWLQEGNRSLVVAGALGALAILIEPAARGTTPNLSMIIAALGAGIALAMNPKKPGEAKA